MIVCIACGSTLTDEEQRYYGTQCERCETESFERLEAWRLGAGDDDLDKLYDAPAPVKH